jgi:hypothetical protein
MHCIFDRAADGKTLCMTSPSDTRATAELVVARANGDPAVHLAPASGRSTLCGRVNRLLPPQKSFRDGGCPTCLSAALDAGHVAAHQGDRSWINLRRLQPLAVGRT